MKGIGGYFELELPYGKEFHKDALRLNTGRNAFEYILRVRKYKKVYLPYYTCDVMLEPIQKLRIDYEFYHIDKNLKPIKKPKLKKDEAFIYTNYYGLKQNIVKDLAIEYGKQFIVDNAQAFYAEPLTGIDTFYSPRKFFGLPDGAYLYTDAVLNEMAEQDYSYGRFEHLLGRIDVNPQSFYSIFRQNDDLLKNQPIRVMSNLTRRLLQGIEYNNTAYKRRKNFDLLHESLKGINGFLVDLDNITVPMVYPFLTENGEELKKELIFNKIYVATYWPNVLDWVEKSSIEYEMVEKLILLPIDQRYSESEMEKIIKTVLFYEKQ